MNILAIAGSLRAASYNRQLAEAAGAVLAKLHPEIDYRILAWDDVPFMNQDAEHPAPAAVTRVRGEVKLDASAPYLEKQAEAFVRFIDRQS